MATSLILDGNQNSNDIVVTSAAQTASGNSGILGGYGPANSLVVQLNVTAVSGVTPTLDMVVEDTVDGTNFFPIATFTQVLVAGASVQSVAPTASFTDRLRVRWTIGGTTPSFTFAVQIFAKGRR